MLIGLPLLGIVITQKPIGPYLEFPPKTRYVQHAPFSWIAFAIITLCVLGMVLPFLMRGLRSHAHKEGAAKPAMEFPWWGWAGILWGICAWVMAWSRFEWFSSWQLHTFTPLWWGYIVVISALTFRRKGSCMLLRQPLHFLLLFAASAAFWWFFEFLNRYVQNWYYVGPDFGPWGYFWYATLPFSTVLPAVMGTREWILTFAWPQRKFTHFLPLNARYGRPAAGAILLAAAGGLAGIGIWPNFLFPLLWVAPLLIIVSLQALLGEGHIFSSIIDGDWHVPVACALAALVCGFFWEMWNFFSLAKWQYSIPFVQRFKVFEMPILGYAGYLPFGIECAVIAEMVWPSRR